MKRSCLATVLVALCTMPLVASAQGVGIKGGLSYGSVPNANGVLPGTLHANSSFAIGVGASTGGLVGFGIEALYAQRGFTSSVAGSSRPSRCSPMPSLPCTCTRRTARRRSFEIHSERA
jgi:hypothetical protein